MKFSVKRKTPDQMEVFYGEKCVGEFVMDLDGFYTFFATCLDGVPYSTGGYTESFLRDLADYLKSINEPWKKQVDDFFKTNKSLDIQEEFPFDA